MGKQKEKGVGKNDRKKEKKMEGMKKGEGLGKTW